MASSSSAALSATATQELRRAGSCSKSYPLTSPEPQNLPSYPSLGLKKDDAAASAAASLGWAQNKSVSLWSPDKDASAQKAASLANDHKMSAARKPDQGFGGSKTAAVIAAENASRLDKRSSAPISQWGNSAANQAFATGGGNGTSPREPMSNLERQKSLRAAKGAMIGVARPRSKSMPQAYPDSSNAAANALNAATIAHRQSMKENIEETGATPITTMDRQMYTSNPPVKPEVDDNNRRAVLRASALAMAKRMYSQQQKIIDSANKAESQREVGSRPGSSGSDSVEQAMPFSNLQEAAYKLAQERLARLHEEHQQNRDFAEYYGTSSAATSNPSKKLTALGRMRRRASSDGDVANIHEYDQKRSRNIRKQMSLFSTRLEEVDEAKRKQDREALVAAAQRNVRATLEGIDEKMYRDTGRVNPAKLNEWEFKAQAAALAKSEARTGADRSGKVDLGAGKFMNHEDVEEIAAKRVKPVLDEINVKAEAERMRILTLRQDQEKKRLELEAEKARNAEIMETARRLKEEEKVRQEGLKQEAKARKEEEKRLSRECKSKKSEATMQPPDQGTANNDARSQEEPNTTAHKHRFPHPFTPKLQTTATETTKTDSSPLSSPDSPSTRVKNWIKSRLHRPRAKTVDNNQKPPIGDSSGGFIGGHALARMTGSMTNISETTGNSASMREVALAGRPAALLPSTDLGSQKRIPRGGASSTASSVISEGELEGGVGELDASIMTPPKPIVDPAKSSGRGSSSSDRNSKFIEIIE